MLRSDKQAFLEGCNDFPKNNCGGGLLACFRIFFVIRSGKAIN